MCLSLNPLTYWVSSIISAGLGRIPVQCSDTEITTVVAPAGQTCAMYLGDYVSQNNGYIVNPAASGDCQYCPIATSDEFLSGFGIVWEQRWRDFGIQWSFIIFNIFGAVFLYWLFRVPKKGGVQKKGTKGA
jgi:ABC-type multidrug transport system permease subunit